MRNLWIIPLVMLSACTPDYPMDKPGTWSLGSSPSSNDANLRAMVVNPHDLVEGRGERNTLGAEAAPPVKRLLTGNRYPLPVAETQQFSGNSTEPTQQQNQNGQQP